MKIVIDIDDDLYTRLFDNGIEDYEMSNDDISAMAMAIRKGIPLPKGHGRLIDADRLKTHFIGTEQGTDLEVYLEPTIINAPTIIEADTGDK